METAKDTDTVEAFEYGEVSKLDVSKPTGDVMLLDAAGHVRRVPMPSSDPNDPLNMHRWRKLGVIVPCCWFSVFSLVLVGGAGPILPVWIKLYAPDGISAQEVVSLTTYPSLVMAFGAAKSTTYQAHMACRILQGVATGATESILPLIIADISFLNERGLLFGAYWGTQNLINAIFTITVSFLVADTNWQRFYWLLRILAVVGTLMVFFIVPETRYNRSPQAIDGQIYHTDEFGVTQAFSVADAERLGIPTDASPDQADVPKLSYWQTLQVFYRPAPGALQVGLGTFGKMVSAMSSPAVVWAVLATSISLGVGISMTLTYGTILTGDFGWSEASVGLVNCGIFPASLFLMLFAGYLGDKLNLFLAKRHGGTHKPEDSLASFVFPTLVSAIGIIIYALTAQHPETHSYWGIVMGWTLYEFGFIVALITATHFAAEAYPQNPGPALVVVVGLKNVISFGASFGITPMVHKQVFLLFDYLTAYMILFGIFAGIFACGIPVYFLNPKWRELVSQKQQ
ncbi:MFS general substrate transporter [Hortaea werneckii]|nr:MFS general substrate transporter [Hortaea werneckii]KAI7713575.1 MFS general substrate transporter [Hortaea werneckii]